MTCGYHHAHLDKPWLALRWPCVPAPEGAYFFYTQRSVPDLPVTTSNQHLGEEQR